MAANGRPPNSNAQAVAAASLAAGATVKAAAESAGVGERTIRRWLAENAEFKAQVEDLRNEAVALAVAKLSASMAGAADTLTRLLRSRSEAVRLRASKVILDAALKLREREVLEELLRDLESKMGTTR